MRTSLESFYLTQSRYPSTYRKLKYENYKEEGELNSKMDKREPLENEL